MDSGPRDMALVDSWLQPLQGDGEPCGKDLEYDNDFLALNQAALGKPETQFGPGEPPDWADVREKSEALLVRTRDLRVAVLWVRASINVLGFAALSPGLRLLQGLLENFWDQLHPLLDPDDADPYARGNALAILPQPEGLLGDLRQCFLFNLPGIGAIRFRSVLAALGHMAPKPDEASFSREQLGQMIDSAIEQNSALRDLPRMALADFRSLSLVLNERLGAAVAPDLGPLSDLVKILLALMPAADDAVVAADASSADNSGSPQERPKAALGSVSSRDEALRAIDMVCAYLDRTEPTNPAQLLLRRARRLINHNFLQLIKELAPEALNEAARVMGVDPDSVNLDSGL